MNTDITEEIDMEIRRHEHYLSMSKEEFRQEQEDYNLNIERMNNIPKKDRYLIDENGIDEVMLPTIELLNHKNYFTAFCCSGHFHSGSTSITFDEEVKESDFPSLPPLFVGEIGHFGRPRKLTDGEMERGYFFQLESFDAYRIKFTPSKNISDYERYIETLTANVNLLKWAIGLNERKQSHAGNETRR